MKVCKKCGAEMPLNNFAKRLGSADGLQYWCRECWKTYNAENVSSHARKKTVNYIKV
jgi:transposase-like protein